MSPLNAVDRAEVAVLERERFVVNDALFVRRHTVLPLLRVRRRNLMTDGFEVANVRPFAPDVVVHQQERADVAVTAEEPEQFRGDEPERHGLGSDQRKTFPQIVPNRDARKASRSGTRTITLVGAVFIHVTKGFFVRNHLWHVTPNEQGASE